MSLKAIMALSTMILFALTILSIWFVSPQEHFRPENTHWNGLTDLQEKYQLEPLKKDFRLSRITGNSLIISIPYREPEAQEVSELKEYLEEGGNLIIADDHGFGNPILSGLGVKARFHGNRIVDPLFNHGEKGFLVVNDIRPSPLTVNVSSLKLNYATSLDIDDGIVAANSSSFSFIDSNLNGIKDEGEETGPFPVVAHIGVGDGKLILVSDPSILINGMMEKADNSEFLSNLFGIAGTDATIYLKMDHLPKSLLIEGKEFLARTLTSASETSRIMVITVIIVLLSLYPIWKKEGFSVE